MEIHRVPSGQRPRFESPILHPAGLHRHDEVVFGHLQVVLFARAGRISSMPVSGKTLTWIALAASVLMAFGSVAWCRSAPKVISATTTSPAENQQGTAPPDAGAVAPDRS